MKPLEGLTCIELGHIVAGPAAGLLLAEMGARVIKVEPPEGDRARRMAKQSIGIFPFLNHNKESVVLDLRQESDREQFQRLVTQADILVSNLGPGVVERLGIDFPTVRQWNPRIIYAMIQGFLPGPYQNRPLLDEMAQMASGLAYMTGPVGQPLRAGASLVDIGAATYAVLGILGALLMRERTGCGRLVHAGLYETAVFWVGQHVTSYSITGEVPTPYPSRPTSERLGWGVYDLFESSDGKRVFVGVISNHHWESLCEAFSLVDLKDDPSLRSNHQRLGARNWLIPRLRELFAQYSAKELEERLTRASVPFSFIQTPAEVIQDAHLWAGGSLGRIDGTDGRPYVTVRPPWRIDGVELVPLEPPPSLQGTGRGAPVAGGTSDADKGVNGTGPDELGRLLAEYGYDGLELVFGVDPRELTESERRQLVLLAERMNRDPEMSRAVARILDEARGARPSEVAHRLLHVLGDEGQLFPKTE